MPLLGMAGRGERHPGCPKKGQGTRDLMQALLSGPHASYQPGRNFPSPVRGRADDLEGGAG